MQPYTTRFTLSREYLGECFDESKTYNKSTKPNFIFPFAMLAIGAFTVFGTDQPTSLGIFIFIVGLIDLLHIRYKRAWWLARQMLGRTGGQEVVLTLDEEGIQTRSGGTITNTKWHEISRVAETERGLILITKNGSQQYLSKSIFPEEVVKDLLTMSD